MSKVFHITSFLGECLQRALATSGIESTERDARIQPSDPRLGDFQANGLMALAKSQKTSPLSLAEQVMCSLEVDEEWRKTEIKAFVSGPGFITFQLSDAFLLHWLNRYKKEECLKRDAGQRLLGRKVVIDYSSPNTAKQMHVGHLRSMIIGESLQRLLRFCGAEVIRDNHIGDWGTQFGILILMLKRHSFDFEKNSSDILKTLEALYKEGVALTKADENLLNEARRELVLLQQGDRTNMSLWQRINDISYRAFEEIYDEMDVHFDCVLGESFYRDQVDRVLRELEEIGVAEVSEGALVVRHREHSRFCEQPFLIRKKDGASNYATTDLATLLYRVEHFHTDEIIYVTDGRQQDHFQQLFLTAEAWFAQKNYVLPILKHVWFGTILGKDGKAIKTRSGEPVHLRELMEEAKSRAYAIVSEKNPHLLEEEKRQIARVVGLGAIRYADLSQNRTHDYAFSWGKLLSFEGNTAPYLLYALARIRSIFRKVAPPLREESTTVDMAMIGTAEERALAKKLVLFPYALGQAIEDLCPHFLCTYLYELAEIFSSFYNTNRILDEEKTVTVRRLALCSRTGLMLKQGLTLLGMETLEKM
ncbi:MAG: arginine--tRNA ligase [Puniceicoccales bacterium]|nr:arginine--tRNA ligase [Puniceicoccales bacterium]